MNDNDIENIKEIKKFLDDNSIEYSTEFDNFCLYYNDPNKRSYEIEYVSSLDYPIAYPNYGIKGVNKSYFYEKSVYAENNNSFKMWIKDFEWDDAKKRDVLKSYILHACGKTPNRYYARDCEVRVVPSKEARLFEFENCFYGKRGASLNLGLYSKKDKNGICANKLLMLYTFGKNFFGRGNDIEIIRVGTLKFTHIVGGSSKLLKYFINNYKTIKIGEATVNVEKIKFYSDYDHNLGNSMSLLDFEFVGYTKGGFVNFWVETGEIKNRQPNKHKWVMEQMAQSKCFAIPNAGVKVYVLNLKNNK